MGTTGTRDWNRRQVVAGGALGLGLALSGRAGGDEPKTPSSTRSASSALADRVHDLEAPGVTDFERRIERARREMAKCGLDALFVEATPSLAYFTGIGWRPSERVFGVVIPKQGELVYVSPAFEEGRAREQVTVGKDIRTWQENESPYRCVAEVRVLPTSARFRRCTSWRFE